MQLNVSQCMQKLKGELPSIFLVFGDEPQQKLDIIDAYRKNALKKGFTERHQFTAATDFNWHLLSETANTMSLFSERQIIELELPTGKPGTQGAKALVEFAEHQNDDVILMIHGPQLAGDVKKSKWFKTLEKSAWFCPCYELKGNQLLSWIQQYAQKLSMQIQANEAAIIADLSEGNLLATKQELEKLALNHAGESLDERKITDALVDQSRFSVFQLVDEVLKGNLNKAIKILQSLESEGLEPNVILWNLINENQRLLNCHKQMREEGRVNFAKLRIWQSKQAMYNQALARLDEQALIKMQKHLHQADVLLKSQSPPKPYVILAHLMLMFLPASLDNFELL